MPSKSKGVNPLGGHLSLGVGTRLGDNEALISTSDSPSEDSARIYGLSGWRRALVWPIALIARVWGRTLKFEIADSERSILEKRDEPVAFVLWHNRLFVTPEVNRRYRKGRPLYCLVSASRDGAWLDAFFSRVGMRTVRGSSSRLGRESARALVSVLKQGHDIGVTPDGPRGPMYEFKPGGLIVARRAAVPVLLLGAEFTSAWRLGSWDGFYLPKPFSKVRLHCELTPASGLSDRDAAVRGLREQLLRINPDRR